MGIEAPEWSGLDLDIKGIENKGSFGEFLDSLKELDLTKDSIASDICKDILERSINENENGIMKDVDFIIGSNIEPGLSNNNLEISLKASIDLSVIKIKDRYKNIPKESQSYKNALNETSSNNLKIKIEGLKALYLLANTADGYSNKNNETKIEETKDKYKQDFLDRISYIKTIIENLEKETEKSKSDKERVSKLKNEIEKRENELGELNSGEIFTGTELEANEQ